MERSGGNYELLCSGTWGEVEYERKKRVQEDEKHRLLLPALRHSNDSDTQKDTQKATHTHTHTHTHTQTWSSRKRDLRQSSTWEKVPNQSRCGVMHSSVASEAGVGGRVYMGVSHG